MDSSALESVSRSLESSLDRLAIWLAICTLLVVVGLIVEYWHDAEEFWVHATWPMAAFPWGKVKALVGGLLVTVGVAGELVVAYKASGKETALRINNGLIFASLKDRASQAELKQAQIEQDNIKLRIQLASVQRLNGPRYLTKDEQNQLVKELWPYRGIPAGLPARMYDAIVQSDSESAGFADDLEAVFSRLKWNPHRGWTSAADSVFTDQNGRQVYLYPRGLTLDVADPTHPPKAAKALQKALKNLDFPFDSKFRKWPEPLSRNPEYFCLRIGGR